MTGGEQHSIQDVSALGGGHGLKNIGTTADSIGFAQMQGCKILVQERETVVKIEKILVHGAVANNGRREFLPAIHRVMQCKLQGAGADIHRFIHIMHIVNENHVGEV